MLNVSIIPLKKEQQAKGCSDHRTIHSISHVRKMVTLNRQLELMAEEVIGEDQFGFRKVRRIRDVSGMLRIVSERVTAVKE